MYKKAVINLIVIFFIALISACDTDLKKSNMNNTSNNNNSNNSFPVWETSVITPAEVIEYAPENTSASDGPTFSDSKKALGLPLGSGINSGSLDVVSLGYDETGVGGYIVLKFDKTIINGQGVDFKVFENPFIKSDDSYFIEAAIIFLSEDGTTWYEFPSTFTGNISSIADTQNHLNYTGYAGINPVLTNWQKEGSPKPEDSDSGGDFFDLENMTEPIKSNGFKYIKIVDTGITINDPGNDSNTGTSGFDLDAVVGINYTE